MRSQGCTPGTRNATTGAAHAGPIARVRGQSGVSLLESLIAIVLVSTVILALAAGFLAMMGATAASSSRQRTDAALTSFTESLKTVPYTPCTAGTSQPGASAYQAVYAAWAGRWSPPADAAVSDLSITKVEYWNPAAGTPPRVGAFQATCPASDSGAQRLTVSVTVNGSSDTGQVVVRP